MLLHHFLLDHARNDGVLSELHRELAFTLSRGTKIGRVTEHFIQRNFGFDDGVAFVGRALQEPEFPIS